MLPSLLKVFIPALLSFLVGFAITPKLTEWMYRAKMWKHVPRNVDNTAEMSKTFSAIKDFERETQTPRVGGIIIWGSVAFTTLLLFLVSRITPGFTIAAELDYVSKNQTLLPFLALIFGALFGLFEDFLEIYATRFKRFLHGLDRKYPVLVVLVFAIIFSLWFYLKLDFRTIYIPFAGAITVGVFFIPYFIIVVLGTFSSRVIDGLDGLAAGVLSTIYGSFGLIALIQAQFDIAAFCFVVAGSILVFLWYNIPPARFYMGETGMMGLTLALPIVAFLLDKSLWILVIGFPLVITSFSSALQMFSKKFFRKKVFIVAPLHHHFEAMGWTRERVVMRYWIFTVMCSVVGLILAVIG